MSFPSREPARPTFLAPYQLKRPKINELRDEEEPGKTIAWSDESNNEPGD